MTKKFKKVPVRGISAKEVLTLWRRGELYRLEDEVSHEELLERCQQDTLKYVAAINGFVEEKWVPYINKVWEMVVGDEEFSSRLVMRQKHQFNRYFVTTLVYNLQALGFYQPTTLVNQLQLHLCMEGVTQKNSVYKSSGAYAFPSALRTRLNKILKIFSGSKDCSFSP